MAERIPKDILEAWRELERQQEKADPASASHAELEIEIARLRSDYHRLTGRNVVSAYPVRAPSRVRQPPSKDIDE